jgi:hypothetical protein
MASCPLSRSNLCRTNREHTWSLVKRLGSPCRVWVSGRSRHHKHRIVALCSTSFARACGLWLHELKFFKQGRPRIRAKGAALKATEQPKPLPAPAAIRRACRHREGLPACLRSRLGGQGARHWGIATFRTPPGIWTACRAVLGHLGLGGWSDWYSQMSSGSV